MTIEYAFVIAEPNQVGSAALVGKFLHEATSIYHSFMVFDGPRQLYEADLLELLEKTSARDRHYCLVRRDPGSEHRVGRQWPDRPD